jgi:hypothetical protein
VALHACRQADAASESWQRPRTGAERGGGRGGAGKREKITITNDKGRLSQDDIKRMVEEAEEFAEQDKKVKGRVDARNQLETYCYNMKTTIEDKLGDKVDASEKEKARALLGRRGRRVGLRPCGPPPAGILCVAAALPPRPRVRGVLRDGSARTSATRPCLRASGPCAPQ